MSDDQTDSLPFEVLKSTLVAAEKLNPSAYNPRKISPADMEALEKSILINGFLEPLVVQKKGMGIVGGHQRWQAVKRICFGVGKPLPKLPCYILDIPDRQAKKLNIALNKIGGDFDSKLLADLLANIESESKITHEEALEMGMDDDEILRMLKKANKDLEDVKIPEEEKGESLKGFATSATLTLNFDDVTLRDAVKRHLEARASREGKRSGTLVAEALNLK